MFSYRLKFLNIKCITFLEFKRFTCEFKSNTQLFVKCFGLNQNKAKDYVEEHGLNRLTPETIVKIVNYCKERGFNNDVILKNPKLFRIHPNTLDQYYSVMKEGGFKLLTLPIVTKFRTICRQKIFALKEKNLIDSNTDVATSFIKHLNPCPENFYVETNGDSDAWSDVHLKVMSEYLKWRLNATDKDISRLVKVHTNICRKSLAYLCQNIALVEDLSFTPEKMLKYGYILHAYPKHTKEILEKYPVIAGVCMKRAMRMYPKLITTPPSNIEKICIILKKHNISDEAIAKRMNIFHISPETVELRLQELKSDPDLRMFLHNPNVLKLVIHHNRAKSRLSFLKQLDLKCSSSSVLGNDNNKFDIHIKEGRDANTFSDIYAFLKDIFKKEIDEFQPTLKKHPFYLQVPLSAMEETYHYLKEENFSNESIFKVLYILLYPKKKIDNAFKHVSQYQSQSNKILNQVNKLNLALYFIEKENHFTGDGIWIKTETMEENSSN